MLNIISFLIIIVATFIGIKSDFTPNQLLNAGLVIITAYIFSLMTRFLRLPIVFGYILAGILTGYHGLGLVSKSFLDSMLFIEDIFFMILVSNVVGYMCKDQTPKLFIRYFLIGILSSLGTFVLALGFFAPLSIPLATKIIMSLFSATFSPLMIHIFAEDSKTMKPYVQLSFGGFFFAVTIWGVFTAFFVEHNSAGMRIAFMPFVITVSSILAGVVFGYIADKMLYDRIKNIKNLYPLAVMFLSYPLINELGFDILFVAAGIGAYNGIFSDRNESIIESSHFPLLIVFSLFGMRLSLENAILLDNLSWSLTAILITFFLVSRSISTRLLLHVIPHEPKQLPSIMYLLPCGPMTLILLQRFIPGFEMSLSGEIGTIYSILTTSMMLIAMFFLFYYSMLTLSNKRLSTQVIED